MQAGEAGQSRPWLGLVLGLVAGCATGWPPIDRALPVDQGLTARSENIAEAYVVSCPDVLDLVVEGRPALTGRRAIGPDGRINLGKAGRLRVEGQPVAEIARRVAEEVGVPPGQVHVRVVEYNSRQVYLAGQVAGLQRAVPYQGPEPVLDLLHRVGGLTPGAAPDDVTVVRSHVSEGRPPEVFRVDLRAILLGHDARTNIPLQPLDQIFVGESRPFTVEKCIPAWLRPAYETVCGMRRPRRQ